MARKNKEAKLPKEDKPAKQPKEKKVKEKKAPKAKKPRKELELCGSRVIGNPVRTLIIMALVSGIIGFALMQFYDQYQAYVDYMVGGLIILAGLVSIICYFAKRMYDGVYRSEFAIGILCIAFGLYVALNGGASFSFLIILGAVCALDGVIKLQYTLDLARMRFKAWWVTLIFAVLGIAIGVVILMGLLEDIFASEQIAYTGIALCANALFDIICAVVIFVRNHKAAKVRKNASIKYYSSNPAPASEAVDEAAAPEEEVTVEILPEEELAAELETVAESCPEEACSEEVSEEACGEACGEEPCGEEVCPECEAPAEEAAAQPAEPSEEVPAEQPAEEAAPEEEKAE